MGLDEKDEYTSSDEVDSVKTNDNGDDDERQKGNNASSPSTPRKRQASSANATTPVDHTTTSLPRKRKESCFSHSRSNSIATAGGMSENSMRRRTRLASSNRREGRTSGSGSASAIDTVGTIAQASRIITDLPQEPGGLAFPLDSVMGDGRLDQDGCDTSD